MTEQGVGTNRYAYAFNDPVNKLDPNGNFFFGFLAGLLGIELGAGLSTALQVLSFAQAGLAVAQGADIGDIVKSFVLSYATNIVGAQLGAHLNSALFDGKSLIGGGVSGGSASAGSASRDVTKSTQNRNVFSGTAAQASGTYTNQMATPGYGRVADAARARAHLQAQTRGASRNAQRMLKRAEIKFSDLKSHFSKHGTEFGATSIDSYVASALNNINNGYRVVVRHNRGVKINYLTRIGSSKVALTSVTSGGTRILTHYTLPVRQLKNLGIRLPNDF